jgi:hypothetical protein
MTFSWIELVTLRALLAHRGVPYIEQRGSTEVTVHMGAAGVAALLEIAGSYASDAQSGEWADAAVAAVIASGHERDVIEAAGLVADSALRLDVIAAQASKSGVRFTAPLHH